MEGAPNAAGHRAAPARASLVPTVALTVTLAIACFGVVLAAAVLLVDPGPQLFPLGTARAQGLETALYVAAFVVILPLALVGAPRLAERIAASPSSKGLPLLAAVLAGALAASMFLGSAISGGGVAVMLAVLAAWWVAAIAALLRASRPPSWDALLRFAPLARGAAVAAGALVFAALLRFRAPTLGNHLVLALGLVFAAGVLIVYARVGAPHPLRRWGFVVDLVVVALVLLAVTDVVILKPEYAPVILLHHNLYLGPTNQVLAGDPMLVGTASQYGIAPIYLLAAWFQLAPIGYGTLGFLDAASFALYLAAGYCLLRIAGASRLLAGLALALAVVVVAYDHPWPLGVFPQQGPLRFGLPLIVVLAAAIGARRPRYSQGALAAQLLVVGLSSVWAVDAFAQTVVTFAAIACFRAWTRPGAARLGWLLRQAGLALAACIAAQLVLIGATAAFAGKLPDYGWYLAFVHYFVVGGQSAVTFDFGPWSPALPLAAAYAASAAGIVLLVRRRPEIVERERTTLVALCGTTAYGVALFSYIVDRSLDYNFAYVAPPALLAGALWLSLILRERAVGSRLVRLGALGFTLSLAALLVSVAWTYIGPRFGQSALAHVIPGGESLPSALHRLWHPAPLDPRSPEGERLLERYMPDRERILILLPANLQTEVLLRSKRASELPFSYPWEDSWLGTRLLPRLREAVGRLRPGDRLLTSRDGLKQLTGPVAEPVLNPIDTPIEITPDDYAPLQISALRLIADRFALRIIHRGENGLLVAVLEPHRASGASP